VRTHTINNGGNRPNVPPKGAQTCFSVFYATRPFGHLSSTDFDHFFKQKTRIGFRVRTSVKNFRLSAQRGFHVLKTAKMGTVEGGVLVRGV